MANMAAKAFRVNIMLLIIISFSTGILFSIRTKHAMAGISTQADMARAIPKLTLSPPALFTMLIKNMLYIL